MILIPSMENSTPNSPAESSTTQPGNETAFAPKRAQPTKVLPTDRLTLERQIAVVAAFAAVSESKDSKPVTNDEAGAVVQPTKMAGTTIGMTNAFFCAIGLLTRQDNGSFSVAPEVMAFFKAQHGLSPESAPEKLRPIFEKQWFFQALGPRLKLGAQDIQTVIKVLGEASGAGKDHLRRVELLVEFICYVGLARRDGSQLRTVAASARSDEGEREKSGAASDTDTAEPGLEKYTLTLSAEKNRRIVIHTPATVSAAELKRIQQWLSFQLIVSDETGAGQ
jgi:hypothetical protein